MSNYPTDLEDVGFYLRKSRQDLEAEARGEGETLSKHRRALSQIAKKYRYSIKAIFEEVVSGERIVDRPEMQRLLHAVQNGEFKAVLCMDIDRLGRGNMVDQGIIQDAFKASKTLIITPRKVYDLQDELDEEWSEFEAFMARRELKLITRRMQRGRRMSAGDGKSVAKKPPYGYLRDDNLKLYPDPETAPVVRMIFQLSADGYGTSRLAKYLTDLGIPTPAGNPVWERSSIYSILKNPVYQGHIIWGRIGYDKTRHGVGYTRTKRSESEWIKHDNAHEPLVDEDTYSRYLERISHRQPKTKESKVLSNPLATLVYCSECGRTMIRQQTYNRPHNSLWCKTYGCPTKSARFEMVEERIVATLSTMLKQWKMETKSKRTSKPDNTEIKLLNKRKEEIITSINELQTQRGSLHDLLESKVYDVDTFLERNKNIGDRLDVAHQELSGIEESIQQLEAKAKTNTADIIPRLAYVIESYRQAQTAQKKNELLKTVIERVVYTRKKEWKHPENFELEIFLNF